LTFFRGKKAQEKNNWLQNGISPLHFHLDKKKKTLLKSQSKISLTVLATW